MRRLKAPLFFPAGFRTPSRASCKAHHATPFTPISSAPDLHKKQQYFDVGKLYKMQVIYKTRPVYS